MADVSAATSETALESDFARELSQLRRGAGIFSLDLTHRIGPLLRGAARIVDGDGNDTAREKLLSTIEANLSSLPDHASLAVSAALALPPAPQEQYLRDRAVWLATAISKDPRTANRRMDDALARLANAMAKQSISEDRTSQSDYALGGWRVASVETLLMFNEDPVRCIERRVIEATVDNLSHIKVSWSIPELRRRHEADDVNAELLFGGTLRKDFELSTRTFWTGSIELPQTLRAGARHSYQVEVLCGPLENFRTFYALTPRTAIEHFDVRVKFDAINPPQDVWLLNGVPSQIVDEGVTGNVKVPPNSAGEASATFDDLEKGLSYGLQWLMQE